MELFEIQLNQYLKDCDSSRAFEDAHISEFEELERLESELYDFRQSETGEEPDDVIEHILNIEDRIRKLNRQLGL